MPDSASNDQFDFARLARALAGQMRGTVRSDAGTRAMYSTDASNYRVPPSLVVQPLDEDDFRSAFALTASAGAPVVLRGGGTSMSGNAIGGVLIETTRLSDFTIHPDERSATVQPGAVLDDLNRAAIRHGLLFGVDPSSASRATFGGMIANNACGAHSVAWGTTADNVREIDAVLADGTQFTAARSSTLPPTNWMAELAMRPGREGQLHRRLQELAANNRQTIERRFPDLRRRISGYALDSLLPAHGYDLARLLCGSEGTLAATVSARIALVQMPAATVLLVAGFASSVEAARSVPVILPFSPLTIESINSDLVERLPQQVRTQAYAAGLPIGASWLLIDVGGPDLESARRHAHRLAEAIRSGGTTADVTVITSAAARAVLWRCRRDGTGLATRRADGKEAWAGWEDAAVPPERLPDYLSELDELLRRSDLTGSSYGHFGEGCMHMRVDFDLLTPHGIARYRSFVEKATELVVLMGGSVSGEHGDGRARSELLARMYGTDATRLFAEVKEAFDPSAVMNPGIIVSAASLDRDLRLVRATGRELLTMLDYPRDGHSFANAQRRCVGVAKCRQSTGGVMCPSYQVTKEEQHSTRGRARLLWEMVEGSTITTGWRSKEVREALDLCLSCKGCLSDCPVNVDMATYKSEFLHHFYRRRLRPRSHYSMGWLPTWARIASRTPRLVNAIARGPAAGLLKRLAGVAPERDLPTFSETTFRASHASDIHDDHVRRVVLWPDTFTDHFAPQVGHAAIRVLRAAGIDAVVPTERACCGLTWVSTGQLQQAKSQLTRVLDILSDHLTSGDPIVVLEPSCLAVFRHDARNMLPNDPRAERLAEQARSLAEILEELAPEWGPPVLERNALVQVHCHQHAVVGFDADRRLMARAGIQPQIPDSGCCGLAGNFGFEAEHYAVSKAAGERVLLPAVRGADADTEIIADGFSCRTQIASGSPRTARHLAELLSEQLPH